MANGQQRLYKFVLLCRVFLQLVCLPMILVILSLNVIGLQSALRDNATTDEIAVIEVMRKAESVDNAGQVGITYNDGKTAYRVEPRTSVSFSGLAYSEDRYVGPIGGEMKQYSSTKTMFNWNDPTCFQVIPLALR